MWQIRFTLALGANQEYENFNSKEMVQCVLSLS